METGDLPGAHVTSWLVPAWWCWSCSPSSRPGWRITCQTPPPGQRLLVWSSPASPKHPEIADQTACISHKTADQTTEEDTLYSLFQFIVFVIGRSCYFFYYINDELKSGLNSLKINHRSSMSAAWIFRSALIPSGDWIHKSTAMDLIRVTFTGPDSWTVLLESSSLKGRWSLCPW